MSKENPMDRVLELKAELARAREAAFWEAAGRLRELRMAEREWLPATGLHQGEQELRRMADEARQSGAERSTPQPQEGSAA